MAGTELIFFKATSRELCSGFVQETELMTLGYLVTAKQGSHSQGLSTLSPHSTTEKADWHKKLGWDTARTAGPNCPKGCSTSHGTMLSTQARRKSGQGSLLGD